MVEVSKDGTLGIETKIALNKLLREAMKKNLLNDILLDMTVCKLEGWDCLEYLRELKQIIDNFLEKEK